MKKYLSKIDVSPILYIVVFLSLISGLFKEIIVFILILIIHELGHITMSKIFKWKIDKISFNIYGGYITYDEEIDKPFVEELLITIAGFLSQIIFFIISYILFKLSIIDIKVMFLIKKYTMSIILFNLIPIIPLDGSKVLGVILNIFLPYKKTLQVLNYISLISLIIIFSFVIYYHVLIEVSYIIIFSFLIRNIIINFYEEKYLFNKFLLQRYMTLNIFKKKNYINGLDINKMKRQKNNLFIVNDNVYSEKEVLFKKNLILSNLLSIIHEKKRRK